MKFSILTAVVLLASCKDKKPEPPPAPPSSASVVQAVTAPSAAAGDAGRGGKHGREDRREPAENSGAAISLEVRVGGGASKTWTKAMLDGVPKYTQGSVGNEGESRDTWSLRELAQKLVGPKARVVRVVGPDETKTIDKAAWENPKQTPILHTTRRGSIKFRYADSAGKWGDTEVRDVSRIDVEPGT